MMTLLETLNYSVSSRNDPASRERAKDFIARFQGLVDDVMTEDRETSRAVNTFIRDNLEHNLPGLVGRFYACAKDGCEGCTDTLSAFRIAFSIGVATGAAMQSQELPKV